MLLSRILTAVPLLIWLIYSASADHPLLLIILLFLAITLAGSEFVALRWVLLDQVKYRIVASPHPKIRKDHLAVGLAYGINIPIAFAASVYLQARYDISIATIFAWSTTCLVCIAIYFYHTEKSLALAVDKIINASMGFVYLSIPGLCALYLAQTTIEGSLKGGPLYFVLGTTAFSDVGAYGLGRLFGRTKLLKNISPSKTIEGALGGLLAASLAGFFLNELLKLTLHPIEALLLGFIAGVSGQIGDLFQSALKRVAKVKDSGYFLPGHGGVLDRIDSHLFSLPILYLLFLVSLKGFKFANALGQ
jgi:CDP-diglyceride synthetase